MRHRKPSMHEIFGDGKAGYHRPSGASIPIADSRLFHFPLQNMVICEWDATGIAAAIRPVAELR